MKIRILKFIITLAVVILCVGWMGFSMWIGEITGSVGIMIIFLFGVPIGLVIAFEEI